MSIWSSDSSIARYRYERFPLTLFVPVILFLAIPILVAGEAAARAKALTTLLVLLFQFRLWDDLSDLKTDRLEFPERVLSRASSLTSFRWLWVAATGVVLLLLWGHRDLQLLYLAALLFFFVWYVHSRTTSCFSSTRSSFVSRHESRRHGSTSFCSERWHSFSLRSRFTNRCTTSGLIDSKGSTSSWLPIW